MTALRLHPALTLSALALLAACGGAGVPLTPAPLPVPVPTQPADRLSLAEIERVQTQIKPFYDAASITPKSQVPVTGGATYRGYVQGDMTVPGRSTDVSGVMEMGVNFGTNRVGGTVGNLVTSQGAPIDGVLTLRNGQLDRTLNRSQVTILSDVGGTLRTSAGETVFVDGSVTRGGFKGPRGEFAGVPMTGSIAVDNGSVTQSGTFGLTGILAR